MSFNDRYRISSHAVISNPDGEVLLLRANYGDKTWGLPGGGLDKGETIHQALVRECMEELGCTIDIHYLSGVYYHERYESQACIFRCSLKEPAVIQLSEEHTHYRYHKIETLSCVQQQRINDCLSYNGTVKSDAF